jgi:hypothetical protein
MTTFIFRNMTLTYKMQLDRRLGRPYPSLGKFLRGNSTDLINKMNGVFSLVPLCKTYLEPMAGVGVAAGLVREMYHPKMQLNDFDKGCVSMLQKRFPKAKITHADSMTSEYWDQTKRADVVFMDNSSTTLRRVDDSWEAAARRAKVSFLYTDTFPFSLIPFSKDKLMTYLREVDSWMRDHGLAVSFVYLYSNRRVMIVRADRDPDAEIKIVPASDPFKFAKREGLFQ